MSASVRWQARLVLYTRQRIDSLVDGGLMNRSMERLGGRHWTRLAAMSLALIPLTAYAVVGRSLRASTTATEAQANGPSVNASISPNGRYVAFTSGATNLVPGGGGEQHVYLKDRLAGAIVRVSSNTDGTAGDGASDKASVSGDGRFVAFVSLAGNLAPGDNNGSADVFVRDVVAGTTRLVSAPRNGGFGNGTCTSAMISADGRYVVFDSSSSNLVENDLNGEPDVFVLDLDTGELRIASMSDSDLQAAGVSGFGSISADGRYVAFESTAVLSSAPGNNRIQVYVRDMVAGTTTLVSESIDANPLVSPCNENATKPSISADGTKVTFLSTASNLGVPNTTGLAHVYVRDVPTGITTLVSADHHGVPANAASLAASITPDGMGVVFQSQATNLLDPRIMTAGQVYFKNVATGHIDVVSRSRRQQVGSLPSTIAAPLPVSDNGGGIVAFSSTSSNLVEGDTNGASDAFVFDAGYISPLGGSIGIRQPVGNRAFGFWTTDLGVITGWRPVSNLAAGWDVVAVGDFDGNRDEDVVLHRAATGDIGLWIMEGGKIVGWRKIGKIDATWVPVAGSADERGRPFLVIQNKNDNRVAYLRQTSRAGWVWTWQGVSAYPTRYKVLGAGASGMSYMPDLFGWDAATRKLVLIRMSGSAVVGTSVITTVPGTITPVAIGDFTNDDYPDVLTVNNSTRAMGIWHLRGSRIDSWQTITNSGTTWEVRAVGR